MTTGPHFAWRLAHAPGDAWLSALDAQPSGSPVDAGADERALRLMVVYVHEHLSEEFTVADIATPGRMSVRSCERLFASRLHTSPSAYVAQVCLAERVSCLRAPTSR